MKSLNLCQLEQALEDYKKGGTVADFAKAAGMPKSTGLRWLKQSGHKRPDRGSHAKKIRFLWGQGMTVSEIAKKVPVSGHQVRNTLIRQGVFESHRHAKGLRETSNGYVEYTTGENKGRSVHVVEMEKLLGRKIKKGETVHHIDGDKKNNTIDNLVFCTISAHIRLHRLQDDLSGNIRERDNLGRFS